MRESFPESIQEQDLEQSEAPSESRVSGSTEVGNGVKRNTEGIAQAETVRVFWFRILLLTTLLISTVVVSVSVYLFVENAEDEEFKSQFNSDSDKVLDSFGKVFDDTLGAADAFGVKMIAYARYSNSSWPVRWVSFGLEHASPTHSNLSN